MYRVLEVSLWVNILMMLNIKFKFYNLISSGNGGSIYCGMPSSTFRIDECFCWLWKYYKNKWILVQHVLELFYTWSKLVVIHPILKIVLNIKFFRCLSRCCNIFFIIFKSFIEVTGIYGQLTIFSDNIINSIYYSGILYFSSSKNMSFEYNNILINSCSSSTNS